MTKLQHLQIDDYEPSKDRLDTYKSYGTYQITNYVFTIFDTIGVKVLYLIYHEKKIVFIAIKYQEHKRHIKKRFFYTF